MYCYNYYYCYFILKLAYCSTEKRNIDEFIISYCYRWKQPDPRKHSRLQDKGRAPDSHSMNSKDDSIRISPPHSDITYDTVYDQGESPFRRSQRLIQTGSANSWRHGNSRRMRSDLSDSSGSDYTWRGMIGGKVEVLNTELRHPFSDQAIGASSLQSRRSLSSDMTRDGRNDVTAKTIRTRCDVHNEIPMENLDFCDGIYQLPIDDKTKYTVNNTSGVGNHNDPRCNKDRSKNPQKPIRHVSNKNYVSQSLPRNAVSPIQHTGRATIERSSGLPQACEVEFAEARDQHSFLELRAARNSDSNEENIYATIKKTFQKIKEDLAEDARKCDNDEEDMMYSVRLTDI